MDTSLTVLDAAFVVVADSHNPSLLNPDFLVRNGIVPEDWIVAGNPICAFPFASVAFINGINILAQPDRVTFTLIGGQPKDRPALATVAAAYVRTLPQVAYRQLGFNCKQFLKLHDDISISSDIFITNTFLKVDAPWLKFEQSDAIASVKLSYKISEDRTFNIGFNEGALNAVGHKPSYGVIFDCNFHHELDTTTFGTQRVEQLVKTIGCWEEEFTKAKSFIESNFCEVDKHDRKRA